MMSRPKVLFVDDVKDAHEQMMDRARRQFGLTAVAADCDNPVPSARSLWASDAEMVAAVVDLSMPDPDQGGRESPAAGWNLIRWLRSEKPGALIAVYTAYSNAADEVQAAELGIAIYRRVVGAEDTLDPFFGQVAAGPPPGGPAAYTRQQQLDDDYAWAVIDPAVRRRYGGQVVAVYRRQVMGAGGNHGEALRSAREHPGCPERTWLAFAVVPYLTATTESNFAAYLSDPDVQKRYGGLVVAFHDGAILGAGCDREAAWRVAQRRFGCPAPDQLQFVWVPSVLTDSPSA
jgi:CheY-like chemotaxis protein